MADAHTVSNFYYKIALENRDRFEEYRNRVDVVLSSDKEDWMKDMESSDYCYQSLKCAVQSIVFSAMCLEAFIYDYSKKHLGSSYTKKHIEKINIESKFIIVPRLAIGKELDKSGQGYERLKKLISDRNKIVHFKSMSDFLTQESFLPESMENGLEAVVELMNEFELLHPDEKLYFSAIPMHAECFA
ncbi:hypothetical protein ACMXYO_07380 [Neptuniibacter sp. QD37_6]|uniref:hypothetical protein n=1 Tax=Neptuniibacter sp. QD37_6 TaxID=3398210 RepID=UPI0039F4CB2A